MKKILVTLMILLVVFSLFGQNLKPQKLKAQKVKTQKMVNFKLQDLKGKTVELKSLLGKGPIVVDFWATWCAPCLKELPELSKLQEKYDDIQVVAISVDKSRKINQVKKEVKSHHYKFLTLLDKGGIYQKKLNIMNIPQTFLLDRDGNIIYRHEGYKQGDIKHLEKLIQKQLPKGGKVKKLMKKSVKTEVTK